MSSPKNKKLEKFVTESTFQVEMAEMKQLIRDTFLEAAKGMQVMFDEQNRQHDLKFATKIELQAVRDDVQDLKTEMKALKSKMDQTFDMTVAIVGELKAMREEHATGHYRQVQHSDQLENHEIRLVTIEDHLGLN